MGHRPISVFVVGAGVASVTGVFLNWGTARIGPSYRTYRGIDVPLVSWFALALSAGVILAGAIDVAGRRAPTRPTRAILVVIAFFSALLLVMTESVGALVPTWVVPKTARRLTAEIQAGAGPWLAFGLSAGALAIVQLQPIWRRWSGRPRRWSVRPIVGAAGVVLGLVALAIGRAMPWVTGSALGEQVVVHGWAVPVVGPLSLVGLFAVAVGALVLVAGRHEVGLVVGGAGIALAVFPAAALAATSGALARCGLLPRFMGVAQRRFAAVDPKVALGAGPWFVYAGGMVAACAMALVAWEGRRADAS